MLENIQETLFQIRDTLINDEELRKLVYNDSNNALELDAPSKEEVSDYFSLAPIFEFNTEAGYDHSCGISLVFTEFDEDEDIEEVSATLVVNVIVNNAKWLLTNKKIRPLAIIDRITSLLLNKKFSVAVPLEFRGASNLILTKQISGYALTFGVLDGSAEIENF